jgi:tRNA-Thr(GGU) m(6)t(6)A37 methyltransferase TsaA
MDIVRKVFSLKRHLKFHQANRRFYRAIVQCCAVALLMISSTTHADEASISYSVHPIGHVEIQDDKTRIVLNPKYRPALLRLDDFSHIWVIWWFDRNDTPAMREILQVHPRRDDRNPLSGVFATRAPVRPNLVGLSLCRVISVNENVIEIDGIDAFAGTPVLDLKPYIPRLESIPDARTPQRY